MHIQSRRNGDLTSGVSSHAGRMHFRLMPSPSLTASLPGYSGTIQGSNVAQRPNAARRNPQYTNSGMASGRHKTAPDPAVSDARPRSAGALKSYTCRACEDWHKSSRLMKCLILGTIAILKVLEAALTEFAASSLHHGRKLSALPHPSQNPTTSSPRASKPTLKDLCADMLRRTVRCKP